MTESQSLCLECGLCCSGVIFDDVELRDQSEALSVECLGLEVEENDGAYFLVQPCRALKGMKCSVYEHRPECCRSFECLLLKKYQNGTLSRTKAIGVIRNVRLKLKLSDKEPARRLMNTHFLNWSD